MNDTVYVKVKKEDLQGLIDTITEAYNKLDNIQTGLDEANDAVRRVLSILEDTPGDLGDIVIEEEENDNNSNT